MMTFIDTEYGNVSIEILL